MEVYRLVRKKHKIELSGKGASLTGARWNSKGTEIIYCAQSRALAMAEVVVHLSIASLPKDFVMLTVDIPDQIVIHTFNTSVLQRDWNIFPNSFTTQIFGDEFIRQNQSAVVKGDFNFLINPFHIDFNKIKIIAQEDFPFDKRIFK
jgi:RES domain-containing protein